MIEAAAEAFFFLAPNNSLHKKIRDLLNSPLTKLALDTSGLV